jgi:anti-anti-sigma factor
VIEFSEPEWDVANCDRFEELLAPSLASPNVIIDLSNVEYLDSTCLAKLASFYKERVLNRGFKPSAVVVATIPVRRVFDICRLDQLWNVYSTLEEALRSYERAPSTKSA